MGESRRSGKIECAVKQVKCMIKSAQSALEYKLKIETNRRRQILAWLPTYVADVRSRDRVGSDGEFICDAESGAPGARLLRARDEGRALHGPIMVAQTLC